MCNAYRLTTDQEAMRRLFRLPPAADRLGNFRPADGVWPDQDAPVVLGGEAGGGAGGGRTLELLRWGFPPPPGARQPVTNARNLESGFWRPWLTAAHRCLVPFTGFAEPHPARRDERGRVANAWFAVRGAEVSAFAGVWRPWRGERLQAVDGKPRRQRVAGDWRLFAILTTAPNPLVAAVHPKAMPVILPPEAWDAWLTAPWEEAGRLVRALPAEEMEMAG
ncbi:MAG: SOS response-associated peptidase family protein [Alphaproteobacteria bacterium]